MRQRTAKTRIRVGRFVLRFRSPRDATRFVDLVMKASMEITRRSQSLVDSLRPFCYYLFHAIIQS